MLIPIIIGIVAVAIMFYSLLSLIEEIVNGTRYLRGYTDMGGFHAIINVKKLRSKSTKERYRLHLTVVDEITGSSFLLDFYHAELREIMLLYKNMVGRFDILSEITHSGDQEEEVLAYMHELDLYEKPCRKTYVVLHKERSFAR